MNKFHPSRGPELNIGTIAARLFVDKAPQNRLNRLQHGLRLGAVWINKSLFSVLTICVATVMGVALLFAHHGTSMYDPQHPITLEGTVTRFEFVNPHARVIVEVKSKEGKAEQWVIECSAPAKLYRSGWSAKTLKPGDRITASGYPRKDGAKEMAMTKLVPPNGPALGGDPEQ